ncbi:MAG: hypothetical protein H7Z75_13120 [Ferruginibacter sp.]|nr:hypothetical protein [Cytophagales bacterium]
MPAEKKEVLNLMYLFNEGDLYAVEEKDPLPPDLFPEAEPVTPEAVAEIPPLVVPPESTPEPTAAFPDDAPEEHSPFFADEPRQPVQATLPLAEPMPLSVETPLPGAEPEKSVAPVAVASPAGPTGRLEPVENTPVATPVSPPPSTKPTLPTVLIVDEARAELLNPYDTAFLAKVLQAVNLDPDGVSLVNVSGVTDPDYHYIFREKKVRQFISFGVAMEALNLYIPLLPYEPKLIHGIQFLCVDSLEGIRTDVERKKWLWTALKQLFGT